MSDVARIEDDGLIDGGRGRRAGLLGRLEGGERGEVPGHRQGSQLVDGVARLAPRTVEDRAKELDRAIERRLFSWLGRRADLISPDIDHRRALIAHLTVISKAERQRGLAGHWSYNLARHDQIANLLAKEEHELQDIQQGASS